MVRPLPRHPLPGDPRQVPAHLRRVPALLQEAARARGVQHPQDLRLQGQADPAGRTDPRAPPHEEEGHAALPGERRAAESAFLPAREVVSGEAADRTV